MDVPHRAAARRARLRDVVERLGGHRRRQRRRWATISADEELGLAYLPVESPYGDMYGGLRPGANLYGESVVAIDIRTGEYRWHFQTSHHPLWDYDIPTAPIFVDAVKDGRTIKALAQATKQGLLFVLNRETGEPVWPIPEVRVPQGNVPGEWYSPTQPIPTIRYGHQGVAKDDLIDFTPTLRPEAERIVAEHQIGPIYTPAVAYKPNGPIIHADGDGRQQLARRFVRSRHEDDLRDGQRRREQHDDLPLRRRLRDAARYLSRPRRGSVRRLARHQRARFAALEAAVRHDCGDRSHERRGRVGDRERRDAGQREESSRARGRHARPHGVRRATAGRARDEDAVDRRGARLRADANGERGSMLRAYDKRTGRELAALQLPAPQSGSPMTYRDGDTQYLVIAVSANDYPGELIAYAVPQARARGARGAGGVGASDQARSRRRPLRKVVVSSTAERLSIQRAARRERSRKASKPAQRSRRMAVP